MENSSHLCVSREEWNAIVKRTPNISYPSVLGFASEMLKNLLNDCLEARTDAPAEQHFFLPFSTPPKPLQQCQITSHSEEFRNTSISCSPVNKNTPRNIAVIYSCKVFLGGIPKALDTENVLRRLRKLSEPDEVRIEDKRRFHQGDSRGFVHAIFQKGEHVAKLLTNCEKEERDGEIHYFITCSQGCKIGKVELKPWLVKGNTWGTRSHQDNSTSVFVGGIHSTVTAEELAKRMEIFGDVECARRDVDVYKYPLGSGCVTFHERKAYAKAVTSGGIVVRSKNISWEIKPFLEDRGTCWLCQTCTPDFCSHHDHLKYFCKSCWNVVHTEDLKLHKLVRKTS